MRFPQEQTTKGFNQFRGIVPHNKIMVVVPKRESPTDEIDLTDSLVYAGSHNLSMSAWGKWKKGTKKVKEFQKENPSQSQELSSSEIEMSSYETTHESLNAVNTELGIVFPPGRMNARAK